MLRAAFILVCLFCAASTSQSPPLQTSDFGGYSGDFPIQFETDGNDCISEIDRLHIHEGLAYYLRHFGPLSVSDGRGEIPLIPIYPIGGRLYHDIFMSNYVDLDPTSGTLDWDCTSLTYDGHSGSDAMVRTFHDQWAGVPIVAMLDGVVTNTHDGEFDENTEKLGQPSNYVIIDHGQGWSAGYWHMKNGSVAVSVGEQVRAGQQIGMVGSSGNSNWPHLHLTVYDNSIFLEPYAGECHVGDSLWENQVPIHQDHYCQDFSMTNENLDDWYDNMGSWHWGAPNDSQISLKNEQFYFWVTARHRPINSWWQVTFIRPNGTNGFVSKKDPFGTTTYLKWWSGKWLWNTSIFDGIVGTWTMRFVVNDESLIEVPFEVVNEFDPTWNRPPEPIAIDLLPIEASHENVLTCEVTTDLIKDDLDWDLVSYRYLWSVGERVLRDITTTGRADHLARLEVCQGAVVTCSVTPSDGTDLGGSVTASMRLFGESNGNINCDGQIDVTDLLIVIANWGPCELCAADVNGDGQANVNDILIIIGNWG